MWPDKIFVTGTDTGIGKTLVSAILTTGLKAHYWKPIQSGTIDGTDTEWIQSVSKLPASHFIPEVYSLAQPLSPHAAAVLDGVNIQLSAINLPNVTPLIVEGAGGIMVPLNKGQYILDLMQRLSLPVIVVAKSGLGTINHTLLTIERLRDKGVEILGVVMNGPINRSNRESLEHYGAINVLAEIPQIDSISHESVQMLFDRHFKHYFFEHSLVEQQNVIDSNGVCFAATSQTHLSNGFETRRTEPGRVPALPGEQPASLGGQLAAPTRPAAHGVLRV